MRVFKIFYSWQSDLPGNKTRYFIKDCIDDAIELALSCEAIEAQRDETTLGTTGSPNIVTTLFSKIDDCDLFVADLSLCFTKNQGKRSPNPNVMLELGYAIKTLGWERIICICNTDYGNNYPFDIAQQRITSFSLEEKYRAEVKVQIATSNNIIQTGSVFLYRRPGTSSKQQFNIYGGGVFGEIEKESGSAEVSREITRGFRLEKA